MIEIIFNSFYYRFIIAMIIIFMIVFIHNFHFFHNIIVTYIILLIVTIMILFNLNKDYGLLLLLIALFCLSYNESVVIKNKN